MKYIDSFRGLALAGALLGTADILTGCGLKPAPDNELIAAVQADGFDSFHNFDSTAKVFENLNLGSCALNNVHVEFKDGDDRKDIDTYKLRVESVVIDDPGLFGPITPSETGGITVKFHSAVEYQEQVPGIQCIPASK